jgi:hypothetical protein
LLHQPAASALLLAWCGRCAFFMLGNSNSVATVDLAGAYQGPESGSGGAFLI